MIEKEHLMKKNSKFLKALSAVLCVLTVFSIFAVGMSTSSFAANPSMSVRVNGVNSNHIKVTWKINNDLSKTIDKIQGGKYRIYYKYNKSGEYKYINTDLKNNSLNVKTASNTTVYVRVGVMQSNKKTRVYLSNVAKGGTLVSVPTYTKVYRNYLGEKSWIDYDYHGYYSKPVTCAVKIKLPRYREGQCTYVIYRYQNNKWSKILFDKTSAEIVHLNVTPGTKQYYRVYIFNPYGERTNTPLNIYFVAPPEAPGKLRITRTDATKYKVTWKASPSANTYLVKVKTNAGIKKYSTAKTTITVTASAKHNEKVWVYVYPKNISGYGYYSETYYRLP